MAAEAGWQKILIINSWKYAHIIIVKWQQTRGAFWIVKKAKEKNLDNEECARNIVFKELQGVNKCSSVLLNKKYYKDQIIKFRKKIFFHLKKIMTYQKKFWRQPRGMTFYNLTLELITPKELLCLLLMKMPRMCKTVQLGSVVAPFQSFRKFRATFYKSMFEMRKFFPLFFF